VTPPCPICRATDTSRYCRGRDRLFGRAQGTFLLCRCSGCGCLFQDPMPEPSSLAPLYPEQYWWSGQAERRSLSARILTRLEKAYREFVNRDHVRFLEFCARGGPGPGKSLLDIGCGNGTFLHLARRRGFAVHGMDASGRAVEIARAEYGLNVRRGEIGSPVWEGSRFDFVTMFHVLEHLPDPRLGLRYAAGLLNPGGTLILQVPNAASIQARVFRGRWYGLDVPRHVVDFTPEALGRLLAGAGFAYRLVSRFSLRDNPASIASSLVPALDPIGRKGRGAARAPAATGALEFVYLALFLASLPFALFESACGCGGTLWAKATPV